MVGGDKRGSFETARDGTDTRLASLLTPVVEPNASSVEPTSADTASSPGTIVLDASGGSIVTVPHGSFLLGAAYIREGSDLLLIGADDQQFLIRDFFATEIPPDLISDTGLRITGELASRLAGPVAPREFAQAQPGALPPAQPIGTVETVEGSVTASRLDGTTDPLDVGAPIFEGDVLETAPDAAIGVLFIDNTTFALGENARMVIDELVFDPQSEEGSSSFSVVSGVFGFVSGQIANSGPDNMTITTPIFILGVRGTAAAGIAAPEGQTNIITLLPEEDGVVGVITVSNGAGQPVELNVANATASSSSFLEAIAPPVILTNDQVEQFFGVALANLPTSPDGGGVALGSVEPGRGTGNVLPEPADEDANPDEGRLEPDATDEAQTDAGVLSEPQAGDAETAQVGLPPGGADLYFWRR